MVLSHVYLYVSDIDPNAHYPPILVTTSTRDDRVHPGHARKFVKVRCNMLVVNSALMGFSRTLLITDY
jgi:prolyl oligopeptidase PreP (S9A serine peptidase family)